MMKIRSDNISLFCVHSWDAPWGIQDHWDGANSCVCCWNADRDVASWKKSLFFNQTIARWQHSKLAWSNSWHGIASEQQHTVFQFSSMHAFVMKPSYQLWNRNMSFCSMTFSHDLSHLLQTDFQLCQLLLFFFFIILTQLHFMLLPFVHWFVSV